MSRPTIQIEFPKPYAEIKEIPAKMLGDKPYTPAVRVYRDTPDTMCFQVRTFAPTTYNGNGTKRNMLASASLTVEEAKTLRDALNAFIGNS